MQVTLSVIAGPHAGTEFRFDRHDTFLVGRSRHAHFQLLDKDPFFSRIHFMLEINPPHCRIIDMGSHNGTYVNGQRILSGDLNDRDQIHAGHTTLRLTVQAVAEAAPETVSHHPETPPEPGAAGAAPVLPGYVLDRELGRDTLGVRYQGRRRGDETPLTIRTVVPSLRPVPQQLEDFLRQARFLLKLEHRHLVRLCDVGATANHLYFVSEHVAGSAAATLVERHGPLPIARVVRWGAQLLGALTYAHALHHVHCDVKPANVIVATEDGKEIVQLADFGIARVYHAAPFSGLSITDDLLSSAAFLPPEVLINYQQARPASDQYAVAATLYYLLAGTHALKLPEELHRRFTSILRQQVVPLCQRRPDVPAALAEVIHKAMARTPALRYRNVVEFRQALLGAYAGRDPEC